MDSGYQTLLDPAQCSAEFLMVLASALDQMDAMAGVLDTRGRLLFANQTSLKNVGTTLDQVLGLPFEETPWLKHSEEARKTTKGLLTRALAGEAPLGRIAYVNPYGEVVPALYSITPIRNLSGEIIALVPEGKVVSDLRDLIDSAPLGIIYLDEKGRLLFANPEMERKFETIGVPRDRIKGKELERLGIYLVDQFWRKVIDPPKEKVVFGHTKMLLCHDENTLHFEVHAAPLRGSADGIRGSVLIMNDVTERNRLEAELLRTRIQAEKMSSMGLLISGVAHEINNPLTSIIGCAEYLVEDGRLEGDASEAAKIIIKDAKRADKIVKTLLGYARKSTPKETIVQVNDIITNSLDICIHEMKTRGIDSVVEFAEDIPPLYVNMNQIQQVVLNLVSNAMDSIEDSGIGDRIVIRTRLDGDWVTIQVENNGPPIPEEHLPRLFDPFFTTKQPGKGTGLGLFIAYGIIEKHGGTIAVDTSFDSGTRFNVHLPLCTSPGALLDSRPATPGWIPATVLVVDHEKDVIESLSICLKDLGC